MTSDLRTLGWMTRALGHEMAAAQQYLAQSVLAGLWGDAALAAGLRQEADAELQHAAALMQPLIRAGMPPSAGSLPPPRLGRDAAELQAHNTAIEAEAVRLYEDALRHARRVRDTGAADLFERLLHEELGHLDHIRSSQGRHSA